MSSIHFKHRLLPDSVNSFCSDGFACINRIFLMNVRKLWRKYLVAILLLVKVVPLYIVKIRLVYSFSTRKVITFYQMLEAKHSRP